MTNSELAPLIGTTCLWHATSYPTRMDIECRILDVRYVWNRIDVLITPVKGSGQKWVDIQSTNATY